jgi:N-acetylmuramoyl-L-alanine amidase
MPSILAEIGFVSNPHDEKLLRRNDQREKIAQALFKGVTAYANSLSHPQIARAGSE